MTLLAHSKVNCGVFSRIISLYNSSVQNCQNYARSVPHKHGHERLGNDATIENVKLHLWL